MESLYLLLPLSVLLVLAIIGVFAWALNAGQFEDLEREGWRVLEQERAQERDTSPPEGHELRSSSRGASPPT